MTTIHRKQVDVGAIFKAPADVTFGYQAERKAFSVWHHAGDPDDTDYIILGTGHDGPDGFELVSTVVLPDGFFAFHLLRGSK